MTIPEYRSRVWGWIFLSAAALIVGDLCSGCVHSAASQSAAQPAVRDLCKSPAPTAGEAAALSCTAAQRICFLVREIPAALSQTDFAPDSSYNARWRPQVSQWRLQLNELTKESALESYAHAAQRKLIWLDGSEHDRRLSIDNGDVVHELAVLVRKAKDVLPGPGLGCSLE